MFAVVWDMYIIYKVGGGCWLLKPAQRVGFEPYQNLRLVGRDHGGNNMGLFVGRFLARGVPEARGDVREPVKAREVNTS